MNWFRDHIDPKYLKVCVYASITTLATIAVGLLIYHSGGLLVAGRDVIGAVMTPIVYGMLLCYILLPLVRGITDWLARRNIFKDNFSARLHIGVFITVGLVFLLVSAIICLLVVVITRSAENINMETLQALWSSAEGDIMRLITMAQEKLAELGLIELSEGTGITGTLGEVTDVLSTVVVSIVIGVYFLLDGRRIVSYLKRMFVALFGEYIGPDLTQVLQDADAAFSGYLRGQVVDALLVGTVVAVSYTLISVPYGPIIGLLTGIGNLIPYIGGPVGYITTILVCLAEGNIRKLVAGVVCLSVIMFIDGNLINPRLLSHAVEVHPLVVILALVAGSSIGGIAGMLIAVPTAAFIKMQIERWLTQREEQLEQQGVFSRAAHAAPSTHYFARSATKTHDMPSVLRDEMQEIKRGNTGAGEIPVQLQQDPIDEPTQRPVRKKRVRRRPAEGDVTAPADGERPRKKRRPATNSDGTPRKRTGEQGPSRPRTNADGTPRKRPVAKADGTARPTRKSAPKPENVPMPERASQESIEARRNLQAKVPQIEQVEEQQSEE